MEKLPKAAPKRKKKKRRMRLPPGIGSVHKIGGDRERRKPWRARVEVAPVLDPIKGTATRKYLTIGYFETESDAIQALMEYRKNPYTVEAASATFADVFEMWKAKKYPEISYGGQKGYTAAFKHSEPVHAMKMRDIRTVHLEAIMNGLPFGFEVQSRLKTLWSQLFRFAIERDYVEKNYADFVTTRDKPQETKRTAISPEDREKIWQAVEQGDKVAEIAMIYIYTGMRPAELLEVKKENVDLENRILIGGMKTEAGTDRHIPIHKCIMPFMERLMQTDGEYLVMDTRKSTPRKWVYDRFRLSAWKPLMDSLGMDYTGHYTRHTCATMLREANVPEDIRKLILGHKTQDITDRYTHISDAMLLEGIDALPGR